MKNKQGGFAGIALIVLIALAAIGGGAYVYTNKEVKVDDEVNLKIETEDSSPVSKSIEVKKETNVEVKKTVSQPVKSLKTFTESTGVYSVSYPSHWVSSEDRYGGVRFLNVTDGTSKTLVDISLGTDMDYVVETLSKENTSTKVTFGSNTFTKFTMNNVYQKGDTNYLILIGTAEGRSAYLSVEVEESIKIDTADLNSLLTSIKVDPSKASTIIKRQGNFDVTNRIKKNLINIRPSAELYWDIDKTYLGMCDSSSEKVKEVHIDEIFYDALKLAPSSDIKCNASSDAYVYSIVMPSGETMCADSTGFLGALMTEAKSLSCK